MSLESRIQETEICTLELLLARLKREQHKPHKQQILARSFTQESLVSLIVDLMDLNCGQIRQMSTDYSGILMKADSTVNSLETKSQILKRLQVPERLMNIMKHQIRRGT